MKRSALLSLLTLVLSAGCMTPKVTHTPRTGVEQRLLSSAVDRVVNQLDTAFLFGKNVFVDGSRFESVDKGYALSAVCGQLNQTGANLVPEAKQADVVVEVRCGVLGTDGDQFLIGIPEVPIPVPMAGAPLKTPELALVKKIAQSATARIGLFARDAKTGRYVGGVRPKAATHFYNRWTILFVQFVHTDLPPKDSQPDKPAVTRYE